eukprot:3641137-Lingulodinium_polyedra.AAC.1
MSVCRIIKEEELAWKALFQALALEYPVIPSERAVQWSQRKGNGELLGCPFTRQCWTVPIAGLLALLSHWCTNRKKLTAKNVARQMLEGFLARLLAPE